MQGVPSPLQAAAAAADDRGTPGGARVGGDTPMPSAKPKGIASAFRSLLFKPRRQVSKSGV